jgi:hypothetical protein
MRHRLVVAGNTLLEQAAHSADIVNRAVKRSAFAAKHHFQRTRDEKPLQIVAVVAGTAFVVGALLRIWRPNAHQ